MSAVAIDAGEVGIRGMAAEGAGNNGELAYLNLLGDRIREARARRGMTRKILARDSKVSERYLAQLEAGFALYDAFYRWCRDAVDETHTAHSKRSGG